MLPKHFRDSCKKKYSSFLCYNSFLSYNSWLAGWLAGNASRFLASSKCRCRQACLRHGVHAAHATACILKESSPWQQQPCLWGASLSIGTAWVLWGPAVPTACVDCCTALTRVHKQALNASYHQPAGCAM